MEASTQLSRALTQIAGLPGTAALRREQIKLQVALANALRQTKGYAAPETNGAFDQARALIEDAEALGEPPEDPLMLFSILYGFWAVKVCRLRWRRYAPSRATNSDASREAKGDIPAACLAHTHHGYVLVCYRRISWQAGVL